MQKFSIPVDLIIKPLKWFSNRLTKGNLKANFTLSELPLDSKWFFNKFPYKVRIDLTNKTEKPFFISAIEIVVNNRTLNVLEFTPIKDSHSPRQRISPIAVQPKESKTIYGIIEIGYGFPCSDCQDTVESLLLLHIGKKNLKYKLPFPIRLIKQKPL